MDTFAASIKRKYRERLINCEKQWPPCHSNKLVNLELVEREKGEDYSANEQRGRDAQGSDNNEERDRKNKSVIRTPLAYNDLFKVESGKRPVRKILIEGDAGIGKTTLSISISENWANGKLFQEFELVLLLPLRHKEIAAVGSISELLNLLHSSKKLCCSVADSLEEVEGNKVLIIADGWDELAESGQLEGSFLYKLIFGEILPFVSVVLTSRPSSSAPLHQLPCFNRFVEVRGFSKEYIVEYIQSEFASDQEKAGRLLEQLEDNPLVESVCSVPLNIAIICHLWRTLEEALPTTMTELYKKMILNVILRNIQKKDPFSYMNILPNFNALPKELQQSWALLCKFAFDATVKDQIVFSQEELADIFPHGLADVLCFGLLQTANTILETGYGISFHFLHLTFQEYLAAIYLVKQISNQKSNLLTKQRELHQLSNHIGSRCNAVFYGFICGIYFYEFKHIHFTALIPFIPSSKHDALCRCAFEARREDFCSKIIRDKWFKLNSYVKHTINSYKFDAYSAYDCAAVLYVIANMQKGELEIRFDNSGVRENQIKELADILAEKNRTLQVVKLDLDGNKLIDKSVSDLFHRASISFQSLKSLNLKSNRIGVNSIKLLGKSTFNQLSCLILCDCPLGVSGMQALEDAVCTGSLHGLEKLNLAGSLTDDADVNSALLATSLEAIMSCNHNLSSLDLSRNNLGVPGALALAQVLCQCKRDTTLRGSYLPDPDSTKSICTNSMQEIHLDEAKIGDEGLDALLECAPHIDVCSLSLNDNGIHAAGISRLVGGACIVQEGFMSKLSLDDNPLGLEGAAAVGRMLSRRHCQFHTLSLCRCQLTTPNRPSSINLDNNVNSAAVGTVLCQESQNVAIRFLHLNGNSFTGENIHILAGFMHLCPCLRILQSSHCKITSNDLKQLLDKLTNGFKDSFDIPYCTRLEHWDLSDNQIDDGGVIALMPSLFPKLEYSSTGSGVNLIGNHIISSDMIRRKREEMKQRNEEYNKPMLSKLDLHDSHFEDEEIKIKNDLQRQWEEVVDTILYEFAKDSLYRPSSYCLVVKEKEGDKSCFSNSNEKDNPIHIEGEQHESSSSAPPTTSESVVVEQECCEHSSSDDSEIFHTPPTSPTPTDMHGDGSATQGNGHLSQPLSSIQTCSPKPELKDLDLIEVVEWYSVGLQLGVKEYELKNIEHDYLKLKDRKREMFSTWLRSCGNTNYRNLIKALDTVGESKAVQHMMEPCLREVVDDDTEILLQSQTYSSAVPDLKDLDLIKLVNWQGVGLQLGIEDYELQTIELNYQKHCDQKREMFRVWLRIYANPNYHDLTKALEAVGERKVAQQIREKSL